MPVYALHDQLLPASGAAFSVSCNLTPTADWIKKRLATLSSSQSGSSSDSQDESSKRKARSEHHNLSALQFWRAERGKLIGHVVTARDDSLSIYEVRRLDEQQAEQERRNDVDAGGLPSSTPLVPGREEDLRRDVKVYLLRQHTIFGSVTGLQAVQVRATEEDGCDRILVSFKDARIALLEWSLSSQDLTTISIHTYERTPELSVLGSLPLNFQPHFRADPLSRCAALLLPQDALAVLPFAGENELELLDFLEDDHDARDIYAGSFAAAEGGSKTRAGIDAETQLPYDPSFVIRLQEVNAQIKNIRDFVFLPGFQKPTAALLVEPKQTCTGLLPEAKDTVSLFLITIDLTLLTDQTVLISARDSLPYDALYLTACPINIGGALVVTSCALLHIDQSGRAAGLAVNHWHDKISELKLPLWIFAEQGDETGGEDGKELDLQGSQLLFLDQSHPETTTGAGAAAGLYQGHTAILALADGEMYAVHLELEGRSVSGIRLEYICKTAQPSTLSSLPPHQRGVMGEEVHLWVASMVGDSEVRRIEQVAVKKEEDGATGADKEKEAKMEEEDEMDVDLYGPSATTTDSASANGGISSNKQLRLTSFPSTRIPALGPISDLTISPDAHEGVPLANTVACTGARQTGGITRFEPKLKPRKRRRVDLDGSIATAVWGLGGAPHASDREQILTSCDAEHVSLLCSVNRDGVVAKMTELNGRTIYAAEVGPKSFVRLTKRKIELRDKVSGNMQTVLEFEDAASATDGSFAAGHIACHMKNGGVKVFFVNDAAFRVEETPLGAEISQGSYSHVQLFHDRRMHLRPRAKPVSNLKANGTSSHSQPSQGAFSGMSEDVIDYGDDVTDEPQPTDTININATASSTHSRDDVWLSVVSDKDTFKIISLANPDRLWSNERLRLVPWRLEASVQASAEDQDTLASISDVKLFTLCDIPHLAVLLSTQQLHVYECNPFLSAEKEEATSESLSFTFVKVFGKQLAGQATEVYEMPDGDRFAAEGARLNSLQGSKVLFLTGSSPSVVTRTVLGNVNLHEVNADHIQNACSISIEGACVFLEAGLLTIASLPDLCYDLPVPYRRSVIGRTYNKITSHPATQTLVAASILDTPFLLFDPESNQVVQDPHGENSYSTSYRGSIELFAAGADYPHTGFALQQNEVVCALELVSLDSVSNSSGRKDYIAVGTMISHGEDRPTKGTIYLLDIVETVPSPAHPSTLKHKLKLIDREDLKGPVTALTDLNGFLVHSIGQKLQVKALENDEWLISVAFLDLAFYVTTLQRIKNYLLLGDVKRSVTFVAFQEDPYRLVPLGRDVYDCSIISANFLMQDDGVSFVTTDAHGAFRLLEYAPSVLTTQGGQKLLLRTEYQSAAEYSCSLVLPGANYEPGLSHRNEILYGTLSGGLECVSPVDEDTFRGLQLLQGYMTRNVQHFAGLNPRAHRSVQNETVPRPLAKGVLDGTLLKEYSKLPQLRAAEMAVIFEKDASPQDVADVLRGVSMQWLRR